MLSSRNGSLLPMIKASGQDVGTAFFFAYVNRHDSQFVWLSGDHNSLGNRPGRDGDWSRPVPDREQFRSAPSRSQAGTGPETVRSEVVGGSRIKTVMPADAVALV
jgi:hypothetical protein